MSWRTSGSRGSWPEAGGLDAAAAIVTGLYDAVAYRDLIEIRRWAEELADDPALAAYPRAAPVLGTAAEAAYHRGDYRRADQLAHTGLERVTDPAGAWYCLAALSVAALARTGNWTHQWATLRNPADLLHRLDDHESAAQVDADADHAPDAPAANPARDTGAPSRVSSTPTVNRSHALEVARQAIEEQLARS